MGVEKRLFLVHRWTLCQKLFMPLSAVYVGVRRSAPYVSMGQRRLVAMGWHRKGCTPAPGEERRFEEGDDGLGQGEPMPEVVRGGEGGVEPVAQPPNDPGGVE